eukprot:GFUD01039747.1.p1 GENE.GFUD01039747.1~~GFUD01039747.1.p1  ORF type:complete len:634 (+),score=272.09 GFUD01039747.1:22-1902(+)
MVETVGKVTDNETVDKEHVMETPSSASKEKDPPATGPQDKISPPDPAPDPKSEPSTSSSPPPQAEPVASKPGPAASSVKPVSTASVINTASQAGQTTWQKLSNRIKALERNVTLSSGFLEELSLKYIKQIDELNNAVKVANDAISGVVRREELVRERGEQLASQVHQLSNSLEQLVVRVGELQEEVLARHGLLLLLEVLVIGLVFLLCRPGGGRMVGSKVVGSTVDRRRSLDTIRGEKEKPSMKQEKRRSSIEVGCLPNGQLGSMLTEAAVMGLSKKQRKRKRRRDSRLGLRNVAEELESDDSKGGVSVYDTFHGAEQRRVVDKRKRSRSWSEQQNQVSVLETSLASTSQEMESPTRFAVDQVWEYEGCGGAQDYRQVNTGYVEDMTGQDSVFDQNYEDRVGSQMYLDTGPDLRSRLCQDRDLCEDISTSRLQDCQDQYRRYQDRRVMPRLCVDMVQQPRRKHSGYLSHRVVPDNLPVTRQADNGKSVWFPGRARKGSVIRVSSQSSQGHSQGMNGYQATPSAVPGVEMSNMYTMLDHSVHETSACDTEPEVEDSVRRQPGQGGPGQVVSNGRQANSGGKAGKQKAGRSKSSSPNRQANLLMRRQREAIRKFQPDQAEWLHKKRDN